MTVIFGLGRDNHMERSGPLVVMLLDPHDAYELADFYESLNDGIAQEAPLLRSAADAALGVSGKRA